MAVSIRTAATPRTIFATIAMSITAISAITITPMARWKTYVTTTPAAVWHLLVFLNCYKLDDLNTRNTNDGKVLRKFQ